MISQNIIKSLKERYHALHPLIFHRSVERAKNDVELFDILDSVPSFFPIVWCDSERKWITEQDIHQTEQEFSK
jgi:hypothetical protein